MTTFEERNVEIDGEYVQDFQLTDHFWLSEFRVHCPRAVPMHDRFPILHPDVRLATRFAKYLELIRLQFGEPMTITDCMRPTWLLRYIPKSAKNSKHLTEFLAKGVMAVDYRIKGVTMKELADATEDLMDTKTIPDGGLGRYNNHCHYDNRGNRVRWSG
jgi:hypothetical protein